jgi:hypothetical protein
MSGSVSEQNKPVIVIGDGWSALSASAWHAASGRQIIWITGPSSRVLPPLPSLAISESGVSSSGAVQALMALATRFSVDLGESQSGNFLREFKNKGFREPVWTGFDEIAERKQSLEESLWDPERALVNLYETRFELSLAEIEEQLRARLASAGFSNLRRIEGSRFSGVKIEAGRVQAVILDSGEEIACDSVIYADRWSALGKIQGLPKSLGFTRRRDPYGVLQATFTHSTAVGLGVLEGFYGAMTREAGEESDRHVWGYFSSDGMKSYWTICLSEDEVEDNHQIAKKLRRMKQTLEKMFDKMVPQGGFIANVCDEQVRFEESLIFGAGEAPTEPVTIPGVSNLHFLTDGYGPSCAFEQAGILFGAEPENSDMFNATHPELSGGFASGVAGGDEVIN